MTEDMSTKRGRPKKHVTFARLEGYSVRGAEVDSQQAKDREIYDFFKARLSKSGGKGKEKAIAAAMDHFHISDRSTIQRKIAPFVEADKYAETLRRDLEAASTRAAEFTRSLDAAEEAGGVRFRALLDRLAALFNEEELKAIKNLSIPAARKFADDREELERFRRAYQKPSRKSAANK